MITAAPPSGPRWELADWLELESTCAPDGAASVFSVNSDSLIDPDEEPDEVDEVDRERDERIARLITEVEQRRAALGDAYPFSVSADGAFFHRALTLDVGALVYMFCLLASHGRAGGLLHEADIVLMNEVPDLLQACATWAAAGFEQGPSYALGIDPSPASFLAKLATIYAAFGDGVPVTSIPRGAPAQVKDDGVDVIAWRAMPDRHAPADYLMAQVASGRNWIDKSVKKVIDRFHCTWFSQPPARTGRPAMVIPFCIDPENEDDEADQQALAVQRRRIIAEHGQLFYRYLLPLYAHRGLQLRAAGTHVDMADWLPRLQRFVDLTVSRLQTEAARLKVETPEVGAVADG